MINLVLEKQEPLEEVVVSLTKSGSNENIHLRINGIVVAWIDQNNGRLWHMCLGTGDQEKLKRLGFKLDNDKLGWNFSDLE